LLGFDRHARARAAARKIEHDAEANIAEQRGKMIKLLEDALMLADDLADGNTGYLIECALDEARSRQFTPRR
jgi:hypothetical protein